ncbi:MAG: Primase 2 [Herbinix sp.]|jgi:RecA-family ATPase|nr:Primase 2 [Herbinix sp.]
MVDKQQYELTELLNYVDPSVLDYQEWVNVGMALKEAGYTASDWDAWSRRDTKRYHSGECFRKWDSFRGASTPVTGGTIVQMARDNGWEPYYTDDSHEIGWDDIIGPRDGVVIDRSWIEGKEIVGPGDEWDPVGQLVKYLETLFEASENVGYVTSAWYDEAKEKWLPTKGNWDRTAGELIQQLNKCNGDIGAVLGDYKPEVGAWIRFNPLDGKGVKNENVTEFKYALVESDDTDIDKQNAILRELELPIACLVHSGKKSIHAIVKVEAANYDEYRKRVDYLYEVCKRNGLKVDTQNKNPSRLSRMPGVMRSGQKQFLIDTNIGMENWNDWKEWIEGVNDDLPEPESMSAVWDNLPELSPSLIDGLLRQGHKMLLAGPSKAGKSYALIELCCAIAEGHKWINWHCTKGKILYVNLELDRASCLHRFKDVYEALGWSPDNLNNIDIWNLRGKSVPMDKLAPKLIRRAAKKNYIAIIIDPIYKVITGDENSADQMAHFCNQFDKVCTELGCAVIYCHHHSKGGQGGKKSMDRASGSGVFARDPDALLDLIELEVTDALLTQEINKAVCQVYIDWMDKNKPDYEPSQDDMCSQSVMAKLCEKYLKPDVYKSMQKDLFAAEKTVRQRTAWRIEGTLREFPKFDPVNLWFDYPVHHVDRIGSLKDVEAEGEKQPWKRNFSKKKSPEDTKKERKISLETAFEACGFNGSVTVQNLSEYMGISDKTVRNRIKEHGGYWIDEGTVGKK